MTSRSDVRKRVATPSAPEDDFAADVEEVRAQAGGPRHPHAPCPQRDGDAVSGAEAIDRLSKAATVDIRQIVSAGHPLRDVPLRELTRARTLRFYPDGRVVITFYGSRKTLTVPQRKIH